MNNDLVSRIRNCPTLPTLPTIAMEVLELTRKADVDIAEIAAIITKDPALCGKILRTVNSSFYGRSQHVSTISQAMVILGLQSVKTLVLGFSLTTNLRKNKTKGFDILAYWKRSIYSATAARTIGKKMNLIQCEEAFLAALLKDIGMLVLDQVLEGQYSDTCDGVSSHQDLLLAEMKTLGMTHADAGAILADLWKLPPILAVPIAASHNPETVKDPALHKLCELIELAGLCADVYVDEAPGAAIKKVRELCAARFKATEADSNILIEDIGRRTKEVATLFEIQIGKTDNLEAILKRANETLVEISLQTQQRATQLQEQNRSLAHQVTTDGLTGLYCRAHFDKVLAEQVAAHLASAKPLTLLMMDIDHFKAVNDRYGHPAGDQVLRTVASLIRTAARTGDLAARYGGEEMVLVLPDTTRAIGAAIADAIRRAVARHNATSGQAPVQVTISIGVACLEPGGPLRLAEHLLKAADVAVYAAKKSGRNCVKVFTPPAAPAKEVA